MTKHNTSSAWSSPSWVLIIIGILAIVWINWDALQETSPPQASTNPVILDIQADTLPAWQTGFMLAEIKEYRKYIEQERREYQSFLTRIYSTLGILISALAGIVAFLGIKTLGDLRAKSMTELEEAKKEIEKEAKAVMEAKLSTLVEEKLSSKDELVQALQRVALTQAVWQKAKILMVGAEEDLERMRQTIRPYFDKSKVQIDTKTWTDQLTVVGYDAVIRYYRPDAILKDLDGEAITDHAGKPVNYDGVLINEMLPVLQRTQTPLILYTYRPHLKDNRVDAQTFAKVNAYLHGTMANFPFSLIANTYDAITLHQSMNPSTT